MDMSVQRNYLNLFSNERVVVYIQNIKNKKMIVFVQIIYTLFNKSVRNRF